jgi:murein L,D-transpeptidase YcbB/YkuD
MTRRMLPLLLISLGAARGADPAQEVWDLLTQVASALSERNPAAFLAAFDPAMPGYEKLREHVTALLRNADVQSAIDLESDEGNGQSRTVELTWLLRIKPEPEATSSTKREQRVKCQVEKAGKKWRIVSFEPLALFAPPGG